MTIKFYQKGANIMANKINVKLILELKASGLSQNIIAKTRHIAVMSHSKLQGLSQVTQQCAEK